MTADRGIYTKLKSELREAFPDWPEKEDPLPAIGVIQQLPYLGAVISETLRRYPTIPGAMPRRVVADTLKVGDLLVPKNVSFTPVTPFDTPGHLLAHLGAFY